jgi:hypothetical protein
VSRGWALSTHCRRSRFSEADYQRTFLPDRVRPGLLRVQSAQERRKPPAKVILRRRASRSSPIAFTEGHYGYGTAGIARTDNTPSMAASVSIRPDGIGLSTSTNEYAISLRDLFTML